MKQLFILFMLVIGGLTPARSQTGTQQHRIVLQLTSGDTLVHKNLMKQLRNILDAAPTAQIEIVCHGPGLDMLMGDRSVVADKLQERSAQGISFLACENTIRERKLDRALVLPSAGYVKAGIIHIVERQEEGWSYIKAGY
ncbi:MAG: DsrE family protein [Flavobacteriales bacterium]|nr:DsrE family protein [Flavobacteriales bacterium]